MAALLESQFRELLEARHLFRRGVCVRERECVREKRREKERERTREKERER